MNRVLFLVTLLFSTASFGYEESDYVRVTLLRPILGGNVYFEVDHPAAMCGTSAFLIKVIDDGSKAVYSTLLSAAVAGKKVKLETWGACAEGNNGWGTEVQGIYVRF
jgi:hypothetical protein